MGLPPECLTSRWWCSRLYQVYIVRVSHQLCEEAHEQQPMGSYFSKKRARVVSLRSCRHIRFVQVQFLSFHHQSYKVSQHSNHRLQAIFEHNLLHLFVQQIYRVFSSHKNMHKLKIYLRQLLSSTCLIPCAMTALSESVKAASMVYGIIALPQWFLRS